MATETHFLRWALFWRIWYATEETLSRLPMLVLVPTLGAVAGTAWGVSHPSETIEQGLVIAQQSFWGVLVAALVGGVAGTAILMLLTSTTLSLRYRYFSGDTDWTGLYGGAVPGLMTFELECKADHPIHPDVLGAMSCLLKPPNAHPISPQRSGLRGNPMGCVFHFALDPEPGDYEVRWCATRGRSHLQEIARFKGPADPSTQPMTIMRTS